MIWIAEGHQGRRRAHDAGAVVPRARHHPLLYLADVLREVSTTPASRIRDLTPTGWQRRCEKVIVTQTAKVAIANVVRNLILRT